MRKSEGKNEWNMMGMASVGRIVGKIGRSHGCLHGFLLDGFEWLRRQKIPCLTFSGGWKH